MHIFFSGIGGTAIGPLAMIAKQAGYEVSGSDKQDSQYIQYLRKHGINDIHIGQSYSQIAKTHKSKPIDWYVYSSAVTIENSDPEEIKFCQEKEIKNSKRSELLNKIISDKHLKLVAIAGTHGKTTTTAMAVWLLKQLQIPVSYSVGAKISFGEMGQYTPGSEYFVLEADEFDHNFLEFNPYMSIITGIDWDHHEYFPTRENYQQAFAKFSSQSIKNTIWESDKSKIAATASENTLILNKSDPDLDKFTLVGLVNRQNAWQVVQAVNSLTNTPIDQLVTLMDKFPGLNRRFEMIRDGLYSDYAHTEEKIRGCMQTASEVSKNVVVVYEPLTDRRQHYIKEAYSDLFLGAKKLYWVPSYLAREDPSIAVLSPSELIEYMDNKDIAEPAKLDDSLKQHIQEHLSSGDLVVCMTGGGGGSLDEWLRLEFQS